MKLRALVLLLVLANLGYFAWSQGWLDGVAGLRAQGEREPERLARQFQPHVLRILPAGQPVPTAASAPPEIATCVEAGPFTAADATAAEGLLQAALPAGSWARRRVERPGVWLVYMGRFIAADAQQKKVEELRRLEMPFDEVTSPPDLAPGLSLGRFDSRQAADQALDALTQRGARSARVVLLTEPQTRFSLRIERTDAALAAQLAALGGVISGQPLGKAFAPCAS